jgi:hypothetical protein
MSIPFSWFQNTRMISKDYRSLVSSPDFSDSEDGKTQCIQISGQQYKLFKRTSYGVIVFLVVVTAGLGTYLAKTHMSTSRGPGLKSITCLCGSSTSEAQAMGCKYDSLSASWLPAHCRDDELTAEFEHASGRPNGEWPYWADRNGTQPLDLEQVGLLANLPKAQAVFYSTFGWHVAHCAFYWRKEFRMRAKGLMLENRYDRENHVEHCYPIFMASIPLDSIGAAFGVKIGGERDAGEHASKD